MPDTNDEQRPDDREGLSRRKLLIGGGALGALGALSSATPALARPAWTWSPKGSVAGKGAGKDPQAVWDDEVDQLVASLFARGEVPRCNELLRTWKRNDQALPAGLPPDLHDFITRARKLPRWADMSRLDAGWEFNKKRGIYLGLTYGLGSGMMSCAIPKEARAVYYSKGGADMRSRVSRTAKLGYDVGTPTAYRGDGEMIVTSVKTRLVHAAVRHLLPQSPGWTSVSTQPKPISQADMMVTWHSLPTFVMQKLQQWPLQMAAHEVDGFLHTWQVTAHMLGIRDEYIPKTFEEANAQSAQLLTPVLGPTPEGVQLAQVLLDIAGEGDIGLRPLMHAMTRYMCGDEVMDWLELPRELFWDEMVRYGWPIFVAFREGSLYMPLAPEVYAAFDDLLRRVMLVFLSEGQPISIEMPLGNREHYEGGTGY